MAAANVHDSQQVPNLLHGLETRLYGDSAYTGEKQALKEAAPKAKDFTNQRAYRNKPLSERDKEINAMTSQARVKPEHPLLPFKPLWELVKNAKCKFVLRALTAQF